MFLFISIIFPNSYTIIAYLKKPNQQLKIAGPPPTNVPDPESGDEQLLVGVVILNEPTKHPPAQAMPDTFE